METIMPMGNGGQRSSTRESAGDYLAQKGMGGCNGSRHQHCTHFPVQARASEQGSSALHQGPGPLSQ